MATLEEALAGTRRGERWVSECPTGMRLIIVGTYVGWADDPTGARRDGLPLDGWTRVEEPLLCPRCGERAESHLGTVNGNWWTRCPFCHLVDNGGHSTESAAREAWLKIGARNG